MDKNTAKQVEEFYNSISFKYDEILEKGHISSIIREYIHSKLAVTYNSGDNVLDIGCGTATDAVFLAKHGVFITALDPSVNMLGIAKDKALSENVENKINFIQMRGDDIYQLKGKIFDGAYSDLDALNYIDDLKKFSTELAGVLKPNSKVYFVMLNKVCLTEWFHYFVTFRPVLAFRKLFNRANTLKPKLNLYYPGRLKKIFSGDYNCRSIRGFGIFLPPDSFSGFYRRLKWFYKITEKIEAIFASWFLFYNFSDQYIIELERK